MLLLPRCAVRESVPMPIRVQGNFMLVGLRVGSSQRDGLQEAWLSCMWQSLVKDLPGHTTRWVRQLVRRGLIEVQPPYDLSLGHNFFSDDGRARLEDLERDPDLFAEHWAPCCKLFSRARGRPITLSDGEVIQGHQAVRDGRDLMGSPGWAGKWDRGWGTPTPWPTAAWATLGRQNRRRGLQPLSISTIHGCGIGTRSPSLSRTSTTVIP